jgi:hypothetical protein
MRKNVQGHSTDGDTPAKNVQGHSTDKDTTLTFPSSFTAPVLDLTELLYTPSTELCQCNLRKCPCARHCMRCTRAFFSLLLLCEDASSAQAQGYVSFHASQKNRPMCANVLAHVIRMHYTRAQSAPSQPGLHRHTTSRVREQTYHSHNSNSDNTTSTIMYAHKSQ